MLLRGDTAHSKAKAGSTLALGIAGQRPHIPGAMIRGSGTVPICALWASARRSTAGPLQARTVLNELTLVEA